MSVRQILELAKSLSASDRATVARDLIATLDYPGDELSADRADGAWRAEVHRRTDAIVRGDVQGADADAVHAAIAQRLADKRK